MNPVHRPAAICLAAAVVFLFAIDAAPARTWTNDDGETIEADLLRVRGRTAVLRSGGREIEAPIARLSEADQAWIETYKELTTRRDWGRPGETTRRGQFDAIGPGWIRVRQGASVDELPFERLSAADWLWVHRALIHSGRDAPADFLAAKPAALQPRGGIDPLAAESRTWTDQRGREIEARYLGADGNEVLLMVKGKEYRLPLSRFSEDDRRWVAQQGFESLAGNFFQAIAAATHVGEAVATKSGPLPRDLLAGQVEAPEPVQPAPEAVAAASPDPGASAPVAEAGPPAPAAPALRHINRLSEQEQRDRLVEAFGSLTDLEANFAGAATCDHCKGYFVYPDGYAVGDACPYCGVAIETVAAAPRKSAGAAGGGSWLGSALTRGLVAILVVAVLGVVTKVAMSGGDDEDDDEDDE